MTALMDNLFIKIGFDNQEIKSSSIRGYLYFGMIFMLGMIAVFLIMIIVN